MRACWLKWVGRDWSISADYIWLNYSDANTGVFKRVKLAGRRHLHVPHDVVHSAVNLHAQFYRADEFMIGESDLCPRPAVCDVVRPRPVYISTLRRVPHV